MTRIVIVAPFGRVDQLAAASVLSNLGGHAVPIGDYSALVDDAPAADGQRAAGRLSELARDHDVLLLTRDDGQIEGSHYRNGVQASPVPAGLALTNLPDEVEELLLGRKEPADIDGHVDTSKLTKLQASAAAMTPQRAALARTAILWMVVALLGFIAIVVGSIVALSVNPIAWAAAAIAAVVFGFSLTRINRLLAGKR